jgi:hypothetical protein
MRDIERELMTLGPDVERRLQVPFTVPDVVQKRIRRRQGLTVLGAVVVVLLAGASVLGGVRAAESLFADRISPSQEVDYPVTITTVQVGDYTEVLQVNRDDEGTYLESVFEPDGDRWELAHFPLRDAIVAKFSGNAEFTELVAFGAVSQRVSRVEARLDDGRVLEGGIFEIPEDLEVSANVFVVEIEAPLTDGTLVALDGQGEILGSTEIRKPEPPSEIPSAPGALREAEVASGVINGEAWQLLAVETAEAESFEFQSEFSGGIRVHETRVPDPCVAEAASSVLREGAVKFVFGAISTQAESAELVLAGGKRVEARLVKSPEWLQDIRIFIAQLPRPEAEVTDIVARNQEGASLGSTPQTCLEGA